MGEGGSNAGLPVLETAERAGDGSGTNMFDGMGGLLGVPISGFHLSFDMFGVFTTIK